MKYIYTVVAIFLIGALVPAFIGIHVAKDLVDQLTYGSWFILGVGYAILMWLAIIPATENMYKNSGETSSPEVRTHNFRLYGEISQAASLLLVAPVILHVFGDVGYIVMTIAVIAVIASPVAFLEKKKEDGEKMSLVDGFAVMSATSLSTLAFLPAILTSPLHLLVWAGKSTLEKRA